MAKEPTALQRIQKLDEERAKILDQAKEEALSMANQAVADLNALGYEYSLVDGVRPARKPMGTQRKREASGGPCPVCDFLTDPPHDGRKHRSQDPNKKPFTTAELQELGMKRVQ